MRAMRTRWRHGLAASLGLLLGSFLWSTTLFGQGGPYSAQIQAALRNFLLTAHTWTATQTFSTIVVSGCTGCTASAIPGSTTQVFFNDAGTWGANAGLTFVKGASATLRVANGSNPEVGAVGWTGNNFVVGTQGGTTGGTARDTILGSAAGATNGVYLA